LYVPTKMLNVGLLTVGPLLSLQGVSEDLSDAAPDLIVKRL